jgi:hypothetical protein
MPFHLMGLESVRQSDQPETLRPELTYADRELRLVQCGLVHRGPEFGDNGVLVPPYPFWTRGYTHYRSQRNDLFLSCSMVYSLLYD